MAFLSDLFWQLIIAVYKQTAYNLIYPASFLYLHAYKE